MDAMATSLRRSEAETRAARLKLAGTLVELDLTDPTAETFTSRVTIRFSSRSSDSFLDFTGHELLAATLNGVPLDSTCWRAGRITLSELQASNTVVVEGRMGYSSDGEGLHRHIDPQDQRIYLYAMSFLDAAPRWFACFDQPDLKSSYELRVRVPTDWMVIGNGPAERVGRDWWRIVQKNPLSTYFVTLVAGPYASVLDEHEGIGLGIHARASLSDQLSSQAADVITVTKQSLDYYHRVFGRRYPFGEYHQAFVPDFNAGAMENPGCVTLRDTFLYRGRATQADRARRAGIIAHEVAHMWFGDLVTMRWWDDLWLNESFAEYMAHRCCTEATDYPLWTEFGVIRKDWGSVADQSPSTHPVAGEAADAASALQNFDGISYAKGAAVLRQLVTYLGESVFLSGLDDYFDRYGFANADLQDLLNCWSRSAVMDLKSWAKSWLLTTGMDTLDVTGVAPHVMIGKAADQAGTAKRTHAIGVGAVDPVGRTTEVAAIHVGDLPVPVTVPAETVLVIPDLLDASWAKIRFGPGGWSKVAAVLPLLDAEQPSVVVYNAIRDAVRDVTLDPAAALDLLCAALSSPQPDVILSSLGAFAADQLAGAYCPVPSRQERLARIHQTAWSAMARCQPGSDHQLTAFRLVVRTAVDVNLLHRWYRDDRLPAGVELDPEVRWEIVERAAILIDDNGGLIADALDRDHSSAAQVHAARARAALPKGEAKETAWSFLMRPSAVTAYEVYATAEGFFQPSQSALTEPFVRRYFTEIGNTAQFRTGWALAEVAARAFPWTFPTPITVDYAEQALAAELAAPLRRALVDGTDRLRRALRSLRAF